MEVNGMEEYLSEVKIEKLPALRVATYRAVGNEPENESIEYVNKWVKKKVIDTGLAKEEDLKHFGFDIPIYPHFAKKGYRGYEAWKQIPESVKSSEHIVIKEIQEDTYATIIITEPFKAPFERIGKGWKFLVNWVNSGEYKSKFTMNRYCLEEVYEENGIEYMKLYEPVK